MEVKVIDNANCRIDKYLTTTTKYSRSFIQKLLDEKQVFVNGSVVSKSYKVCLDDVIFFEEPVVKESTINPQDIDIDIIFEDDDIAIINKPKHMVVHPGAGNFDNTLVNALLFKMDNLSGIGGIKRPGIVHRIDKDTSGLLVVAKNDVSHEALSNDFKCHNIEKTYIALVRGIISEDSATINIPILRNANDRKKMGVSNNGKNAVTHFEVLERFASSNTTLIKVKIDTGRTHQIRVHMAHIKHPIIGDLTYSNGNNIWNISGQMLHSYNLEFTHPTTKRKVIATAVLPKYFQDVLCEQIDENKLDISDYTKELINAKTSKVSFK